MMKYIILILLFSFPALADSPPIIDIFKMHAETATGVINATSGVVNYIPPGTAGNFLVSSGSGWISSAYTPPAATWGQIVGTLSSQTDLQAALNLKANTSSLSAVALSGHYSDLIGVPTLLSQFTNDTNFITAAQAPVQSVAGRTGVITLTKSDVGLGNVDNTSDANKPVSTATQTALNLKYDASNPAGYITSAGVPVTSVFGRTGTVTATSGDYTTAQVTENTNLYFTNARAQGAVSATSPLVDTAGVFSIPAATTSVNGYLTSTDWNTFNSKQSALTFSAPLMNTSNVVSLAASGATAGTYTNPSMTVDTYGRVTAIATQNSPGAFIVYVNKAGNDSTCTIGNPNTPCLTIAGANAIITNATNANRYTIAIGPGVYTETNLNFIPWVWLKGQNYSDTIVRSAGAPFGLSAAWSSSIGARGGFQDIYFQNGLGFNFDLTTTGTLGTAKIDMTNVYSNAQCDFKGRPGINDSLMITGFVSLSGSPCNIQDFQAGGTVASSYFTGGLNLTSVSANQSLNVNATATGPLTINSTSPNAETSNFTNSFSSTLSISGSTSLPKFNSGSLPFLSNITLSSGGNYTLTSDNSSSTYFPATPSNWSPVPTNTKGALDTLAATVAGSATPATRVSAVSTSVTTADRFLDMNSASATTVTLPSATNAGQVYTITNVNSGVVTVSGANTINGQSSITLNNGDSMSIKSTAGVWQIW